MVHHLIRPLGLAISVLGIIQGIAWFILALLGILVKQEVIKVTWSNSFGDQINFYLFSVYLKEHDDNSLVVTPDIFVIVLVIYLIISLLWCLVSATQICYLRVKNWETVKTLLITWVVVTTVIVVLDLTLTSALLKDYLYIADKLSGISYDIPLVATGILLTLAARGFVLCLVNLISIIVAIIFILKLNEKENEPVVYNNGITPIDAFQQLPSTIPNPWYVEAANTENALPSHVNSAFVDDDDWDAMSLARSKSFQYPSSHNKFTNNNYNPSEPSISRYSSRSQYNNSNSLPRNAVSTTNRNNKGSPHLATVGKSGKNSPVLKVSPPRVPPVIPPPDYSPPPSPKPKPVLKSNNVYRAF